MSFLPQEEEFEVVPVGIRYRCEYCQEGEMIAQSRKPIPVMDRMIQRPIMIEHVCTHCGKTMLLPKSYPYIDWRPLDKT